MPARFQDVTWGVDLARLPKGFDFVSLRTAHAQARDYVELQGRALSGRNLAIPGSIGCGKTHLAAAVNNGAIGMGLTTIFAEVNQILQRIKSSFNDGGFTEDDMLRALVECDLLVIDDLGRERNTDWVETQLWLILSGRYDANRPTVFTTNMTSDEAVSTETRAAMFSRLKEDVLVIQMPKVDLRKKKS